MLGRRTAAWGFARPAYVGGETVQETGGGVCQGSSTVYLPRCGQTWKLWNDIPTAISPAMSPMGWTPRFTMGRRTSDSETIRPSPFKWWALCRRSLTVSILGTKSDNITVEMTNQTVGTTGYKTVYKVDSSLPAGSTRVSVTPYAGYTVKVYRNPMRTARLKDTKLESTSVYRSGIRWFW